MATTLFVDLISLTQASWFNNIDTYGYNYLTSVTGTDTIAATGPASMTAYAAGQKFSFIPANDNTGATTINITQSGAAALGAKNIFCGGAACIGGEIQASIPCTIQYDGTQFNVVGPYNGGAILGAIRYGGVTLSNAVTGTGNMVLSASPTLTGTLTAAIANFSGAVTLSAASPQLTLGVVNSISGGILMYGSTSGSLTLKPAAAAGAGVTITFPATSVTLNAAGDLSGTTLAAGVTASSLTSLGTIAALLAGTGSFTGNMTLYVAAGSPTFKIGKSSSAGEHGYFQWTDSTGVFDIGNQAVGPIISMSEAGAVTIPGLLGVTGAITGASYSGGAISGTTLSGSSGAAVGGATAGTSGIAFPATAVAVADANTLDDYEEGTYTATLAPSTSGTISVAAGNSLAGYTKVGRFVFITGYIYVASVSSPVGTSIALNLPFAIGNLSETAGAFAATAIWLNANASYARTLQTVEGFTEGATSVLIVIDASTIEADDRFAFSFGYHT